MLVLLLGTGLYLTIGMGLMPIRRIPTAFRLLVRGRKAGAGDKGDITPFQSLMTALSATIGNGNIVGVAAAIAVGGPGAVFWMWMTALVGMATKYSEAVLAIRYREVDADGRYVGGPMYYIKNGLGRHWAWLAFVFAFFATIAGFGIGNMFQAKAVVDVVGSNLGVPNWQTGLVMAVLTFLVIIGGVKRIGQVAEFLVPFMAVIYILGGLAIIVAMHLRDVPAGLAFIVRNAFTPTAAAGGFAGAAVWIGIQYGVARGIFSNEAGLGSAPIAHAAAQTKDPVRQGMIAMLGTFIDTICRLHDHRARDRDRSCAGDRRGWRHAYDGRLAERQDRRRSFHAGLQWRRRGRALDRDVRFDHLRLYDHSGLELLRRTRGGISLRREDRAALSLSCGWSSCSSAR